MSYSLFKVGKVWHYRFQVGKVRAQKSTRETARVNAEPVAQRAYEKAKLWARGESPVPTLAELAQQWMEVHQAISSEAHLKSVEKFARLHLYQLRDISVSQIRTEDVEHARNEHLKTHAPASVNHWLRLVKLLGKWAVKRGVMPHLPWNVGMLKVQKRPRPTLPVTSAKAWLEAVDAATVDAPTVATAIRLMLGLGLRESEATSARWEWVDWDRSTYTPGVTKGREAEPVPMPAWLAEHLQDARAGSGLIAQRADGSQHPSGFSRDAMMAANKACGIKGLTPHRLRGTFATLLSEAGVPIQMIQAVMRHKSPMTTMNYLEKNLATATAGQERIAERMGFARRESGAPHPANPHEPRTSE
jgi:integrase/recombinase XerC